MRALLSFSYAIDRILTVVAKIGAWAGLALVIVVCYDVVSRYFGVPKPFGLNSTQIQESEYWLHTALFALVIGYGYTRQAHVRIDLVRDALRTRTKFLLECLGCLIFLIPYTLIGFYYTTSYAYQSYLEGEVSKSVIGLTNIWILKTALPIMFALLFLAGLSQLIKSFVGLCGRLWPEEVPSVLGGDH